MPKNVSTEVGGSYLDGAPFMERLLFAKRPLVIAIFILLTIFFGYHMLQMKPEASFLEMIPTYHPFIKNYIEHKDDLKEMGNIVRICVETTKGSILSKEYLDVLKKASDDVFFISGVNRAGLKSLWTSNCRWLEVTEEGFEGGEVIPMGYSGTQKDLEQVRANIMKASVIGTLVANDFKSTIILAPLHDIDPETRKPLDYHQFAKKIEAVRSQFQNDDIKIHITGFAKIVGDLIEGSTRVLLFFFIAFVILLLILWHNSRCPKSTAMRAISSLTAVVWQLGIMRLFGLGLNPYSMLVPFLMFALGVSHGIQMFNAMALEMMNGADKLKAARLAYRSVYIPGLAALFTDMIGFATLMVIQIGVIQDIAVGASIGVAVVAFTDLMFLPLLMSYSGISNKTIELLKGRSAGTKHPVWSLLTRFTEPKWAYGVVLVACIGLAAGITMRQDLKTGDLDPGAPELRQDSRYNMDNAHMNAHYSASSDIFVVMLKTPKNGLSAYRTVVLTDMLDEKLTHEVEGVQNVVSHTDWIKYIGLGNMEGHLKWLALPRSPKLLDNLVNYIPQNFQKRELSFTPMLVYLDDHRAETLERVVATVDEFAKKYNTDTVQFVMGAGNAGIEAATNVEVERALIKLTVLIYGVVFLVCLVTYRNFKGAVCVVAPLVLTSVLCESLMAKMGIGIKVATLPVIAVGVGIGVDYGIYIYNKLVYYRDELGHKLTPAYYRTLNTTGRAVSFTGITLSIGVATWAFSPIKFQADMGFLLTFMFLWNMVGAMVLLPALARILWKKR